MQVPSECDDHALTRTLASAQAGETGALECLFPLVEPGLRARVGRQRARGLRPDQVPTTAVVHDAFFRLTRMRKPWRNRDHYFAMATVSVRRVLLDLAKAARRAGRRVEFAAVVPDHVAAPVLDPDLVLDLDAAIDKLSAISVRWGKVAELHLYGGRNNHEIAATLDVSLRTVEHDWSYVRAWLHRELQK